MLQVIIQIIPENLIFSGKLLSFAKNDDALAFSRRKAVKTCSFHSNVTYPLTCIAGDSRMRTQYWDLSTELSKLPWILCGNHRLQIEVTARQKRTCPRCLSALAFGWRSYLQQRVLRKFWGDQRDGPLHVRRARLRFLGTHTQLVAGAWARALGEAARDLVACGQTTGQRQCVLSLNWPACFIEWFATRKRHENVLRSLEITLTKNARGMN